MMHPGDIIAESNGLTSPVSTPFLTVILSWRHKITYASPVLYAADRMQGGHRISQCKGLPHDGQFTGKKSQITFREKFYCEFAIAFLACWIKSQIVFTRRVLIGSITSRGNFQRILSRKSEWPATFDLIETFLNQFGSSHHRGAKNNQIRENQSIKGDFTWNLAAFTCD